MDPLSLFLLFGLPTIISLIAVGTNLGSTIATNKSNERMQREINATNERNVAATNEANAQQAELSYQRNGVSGQLKQMMENGISRQGALNALTGAGSYQPAQFESAQGEASKNMPFNIDNALNSMSGMFSNSMQMQQFDLAKEQYQHQKKLQDDANAREEAKHSQDLAEQRLRMDKDKRDYDATTKANEAWTLISPLFDVPNVNLDNIYNLSDLVSTSGIKDTDEWKAVRSDTDAYNKLEAMFKSRMETARASGDAQLVRNAVDMKDVDNAIKLLNRDNAFLQNKQLKQKIQQDAALFPVYQALQNGQLQKLYQDMKIAQESHDSNMSLADVQRRLQEQQIDINAASRAMELWRENLRKSGTVGDVEYQFLMFLEAFINPVKGVIGSVTK